MHIPDLRKHPAWGAGMVFAAGFLLMGLIQFSGPGIVDPDGYFHIKSASLISEQGLFDDFPWWTSSVFSSGYVDEYWLYHLLLVPFTWGDDLTGAKLASVFFAAALLASLFLVLRAEKVPLPWLFVVLVCTSGVFLYRLQHSRAIALSVLLLIWLFYALRHSILWAQFAIPVVFMWSFPAWYLVWIVGAVWGVGEFAEKRMIPWKPLGMIALGSMASIIISPYFPANLSLFYFHGVHLVYSALVETGLDTATELAAPLLRDLFRSLLVWICLGWAVWVYAFRKGREKSLTAPLLLALGFTILSFIMVRGIDYAVPFAVYFFGLGVKENPSFAKRVESYIHACDRRVVWITVSIILLCAIIFILGARMPLMTDEPYHHAQSVRFSRGAYLLDPFLAMLPGYHFIASLFVFAFQDTSAAFLRGVNLFWGIAAAVCAYHIYRRQQVADSGPATLQTFFMPIIFPFFFVVYTEALSLSLILLSWLLFIHKKFPWSGVVGLIACIVRQNNIVWVLMMASIVFFRDQPWKSTGRFTRFCREYMMYSATIILFVLFAILNKGFSIGDRAMHPTGSFALSNFYFGMALFTFLFLPFVAVYTKNIFQSLTNWKQFVWVSLLAILFFNTFEVIHPYNQDLIGWAGNIALHWFSTPLGEIVMFIMIVLAVLLFQNVLLVKKDHWPFYVWAGLLYLLTSSIQIRYFITGFALFQLMRQRVSSAERPLLYWWIFLSLLSVWGWLFGGWRLA